LGAVCTLAAWIPPVAQASDFIFHFDTVFSGTSPVATNGPWIDAALRQLSPTSILVTISNLALTAQEHVDELDLNLNPALLPSGLAFGSFGGSGGFDYPSISTGVDAFKADGDGLYDIRLSFTSGGAPTNQFTDG